YAVTVPDDADPTMPYYLDPSDPTPVDLYHWPEETALHGLPFAPPPVRGHFTVQIPGLATPLSVTRDAAWIGVDRRAGEYRTPVKVVPAATLALEPAVAVLPLDDPEPLPFTVRVGARAPVGIRGALRLRAPDGWRVTPSEVPVRLEGEGVERTASFQVIPPAGLEAGEHAITAELEAGGRRYALGYEVIDYPHIAPHHLYRPARARVRALPVRVADVRVGYIAGSGDGVPEALEQLGVDWEEIGTDGLAAGDFARFDVIITGARAYEVRDDIVTHNQELLAWVRDGGTLIVQYNKYPALERDYAPWPVTIARPHGRVTDETAPVTVLEPGHPILTTPNAIGDADWEGWVQERGLYFWDSWEGPLTPLLAMSDPGEDPLTGALLVAPLGEGTYVYTALALFRQLPEGVPGAYRLLANMISLGAE
ncbi:MAG: NEW3 domain-containing protein, partial [Gemmatimonadota bacterium]